MGNFVVRILFSEGQKVDVVETALEQHAVEVPLLLTRYLYS